jgi:Xaa-Pro dipeptidase
LRSRAPLRACKRWPAAGSPSRATPQRGPNLSVYRPLPLDEAALDLERLARLRQVLDAADLAGAVFFDPTNIRYATGTSNMQVYGLHNACRYVFVPTNGPVVLFEFSGCEHLVLGHPGVAEIRQAIPFYYFVSGPRVEEKAAAWAAEIADLVSCHGSAQRRVAVDRLDPVGTWALQALGIEITDGQELISQAKKTKLPQELIAIRNAIGVCEEGMRRMRAALEPGITEQALWSCLHQTNIELGGEWIETRLLTSGPRTNPWYQECSARIIENGDIISFDTDLVGPHGYAADISRSWIAGDRPATSAQRRLYALAHEQVRRNIGLFQVGASFREIAEKAWLPPEPYRQSTLPAIAHGIGLVNEYPLILQARHFPSDGYDGLVEADMVLCVESYIGEPGGSAGVKLEQQIRVTPEGPELLSTYPMEISLL